MSEWVSETGRQRQRDTGDRERETETETRREGQREVWVGIEWENGVRERSFFPASSQHLRMPYYRCKGTRRQNSTCLKSLRGRCVRMHFPGWSALSGQQVKACVCDGWCMRESSLLWVWLTTVITPTDRWRRGAQRSDNPAGVHIDAWAKWPLFCRRVLHAFYRIRVVCWFKCHWSLFVWFQLTGSHHCFRQWLGAWMEPSHCLYQWWRTYHIPIVNVLNTDSLTSSLM